MSANDAIHDFMESDTKKLAEIIENYPQQIPVNVIADWWGCDGSGLRTFLEDKSVIGIGYKKAGKLNRAFVVPTGRFVRWYIGAK